MVLESLALARAGFRGGGAAPGGSTGAGLQATLLYSSHALGGAVHSKHVACLELAAEGGQACAWFLRCARAGRGIRLPWRLCGGWKIRVPGRFCDGWKNGAQV